jgi:hypothetical protein
MLSFKSVIHSAAGLQLLIYPNLASGQTCSCLGVGTLPVGISCSSEKPPCESEYYLQYCTDGCTRGQDCITQGYGECCGKSYRTLTIDTENCTPAGHYGCECQSPRTRSSGARGAQASTGRLTDGETAHGTGGSSLYSYSHRQQEDIVYVPDRCRHTYAILYPPGYQIKSAARPAQVRVQSSGGVSP